MADNTSDAATPPFRECDTAPFLYFDAAACFGVLAGAVQIELASRILTPESDGGVAISFVATGRLRCSPAAAHHLRDAIDKALHMLSQPEGSGSPPVAAGKLN